MVFDETPNVVGLLNVLPVENDDENGACGVEDVLLLPK